MNTPRKHHTVPKFLLKNFCYRTSKKKMIHTFDKKKGKEYVQTVDSASTRRDFYSIKGNIEVELILGQLESDVAPIITRIIQEKSISFLTEEEKIALSIFVVVQNTRTYSQLLTIEGMQEFLKKRSEELSGKAIEEKFSHKNRFAFFKMLLDSPKLYQLILMKDWCLLETTDNAPFYISDHPVTLFNKVNLGPYGNLGLASPGIQITLPISSTLSISFLCKSILGEKMKKFNSPEIQTQIKVMKMMDPNFTGFEQHEKIASGKPWNLSSESLMFYNSLQVEFSEDYLYCQKNKFALAEKMISDDPKFKRGLRMTMG